MGGGPAQGARRPELVEDGELGRDRTRHYAGPLGAYVNRLIR